MWRKAWSRRLWRRGYRRSDCVMDHSFGHRGLQGATSVLLGALVALSVASCDDDAGGDGQTACDEIATQMRSCGLLSEGAVDCSLFEEPSYGPCVLDCVRGASCEDFRAQACDDADNEYARCLDACQAVFAVFDCGDSTTVDSERRCDGEAECANGADETGCEEPEPDFACGDGEAAPADSRCNGEPECQNGADEAGCPPRAMTVCPGGF
jgi:hypothetical protein